MLDTNVLVSVLFFPGERMNAMLESIFTKHELVLPSYVVDKLKWLSEGNSRKRRWRLKGAFS